MTHKKYDVILADSPWPFVVRNPETGGSRSPEAHYPTMSVDEICRLPVSALAAENCALFLWCVWPRIFDAEKVINAWGFTYRTLGFEWIKTNRSGMGWHMGMGYYTRANPEPCLLAVKGRMPVQTKGERNLLIAPVRRHSEKPLEQYEKIERLYPGKRYLELFARQRRSGWDAFGNQVADSILMPEGVHAQV